MKDLTHYFHFPAKQKEDKIFNENVITLDGDSDDTKSRNFYKGLSEPSHVVEIGSSSSASSSSSSSGSDIKDSPSRVRTSARRARSDKKLNFEVTDDVNYHTEGVEHDLHSTMLQDMVDISTSQGTPIRTSDKEPCSETGVSKTASCGKKKLKKKKVNLSSKKTNNCDSRENSLCVKTQVINEALLEESAQKKKHSLLFQRNGILSPSANCCVDGLNGETKCGFETGMTNKISTAKHFDKISTISNESTNAFHILMSSRILQSPLKVSPDETEDHMCPDRKKAGTVVAETLMKSATVKESGKKRKKILEDLAERRRMKKAKPSDTSPEMKLADIPIVRCKRLVVVPESDSDDERNVGLYQDTDIFKVEDGDKHVHGEFGEMFLEEKGDKSAESYNEKKHDKGARCDSLTCEKRDATTLRRVDGNGIKLLHKNGGKWALEETADYCSKHQKKQDKVMNQESLQNSKLSTRKLDRSRSNLVHKNSSKLLVGETTDDCSGPEKDHIQLKELVVKVERLSTKKCLEYTESVLKGRRKPVVCEKEQIYESEALKKEGKKQASMSEDRKVKCQLSVCNTKMPSQLPTTTNMLVTQCNKTPLKCSFQQKVKTLGKKSSNRQENVKFGNDAGSEEENHEQKEFHKQGKTNKSFTVSTVDSKCEMLTEPKNHLPSPDETKKRNSLFSYFSKVSKDEAAFKPEKITVKVQIHSPPLSPSVEKRCTSVTVCKRERRRCCVRSKVLDLADQIVVLESHIVKPASDDGDLSETPLKESKEISSLKTSPSSSGWKIRVRLRELPVQALSDSDTGGDSSDDSIFITKEKLIAGETSVQRKAAREQLQNAKTAVTCMNVEQMRNQDDEVSAGEAEEITNCSSPYSNSNGANISEEPAAPVFGIKRSSPVILIPMYHSTWHHIPDVVKLAPLFVRSRGVRKPKVDAATVEARQNFLKSGFPDSVKKLVDMQRSMEEQCHFIFPPVSHVQQREDQLYVWSLPLVELPLQTTQTESTAVTFKQTESLELGTFSNCRRTDSVCTCTKPSPPTRITCYRKLLQMLKLESPDFPIYRHFRRLYSKYIQDVEKFTGNVWGQCVKQKKRSARKSRGSRSHTQTAEKLENCNLNSCVMWTEKYKPTTAGDLVGNGHSIDQLKTWLEGWKCYSDEVQHRDKKGGCKRKDSSSGDEFMDSDTNDSRTRNLPHNAAILVGPYGCGKTSAVYAVANELGYKVLEINTSSKRNGKRILLELQEATQSHQVKTLSEPASCGLDFFSKGGPAKSRKVKLKATGDTTVTKQDGDEHNARKVSIILVEGVDVVYEDEDGFVSAVTSLVASSKRPVILVTNDPHCPHLARFMDLHLVLNFSAPSSRRMSVWLQLICILEGVWLRRAEIERLLDQNCGDVRQTLLQLQFFVLTGGNDFPHTASICDNTLSGNSVACHFPALDTADESSNLSYISGDEPDDTAVRVTEHAMCVEVFTEYGDKYFATCRVPFPLDLGHVWWNLASLLSIPESLYQDRICIQPYDDVGGDGTLCVARIACDEMDYVVKVGSAEMKTKETDFGSMTVSEREGRNKVVLVDKVFGEVGNGSNEEFLMERIGGDSESTGNTVCELLKVQRVGKNCCSQVEVDCMSQFMEAMSALDIMSSGGGGGGDSREPSCRSWDQVPKDGVSLNEDVQCQWWEKSVSRILCHYLLEGNVHNCRTNLQEAKGCQVGVQGARMTFTKPTQQELRWRSVQHAAEKTVLPAVPLWCHPYHHSLASDYIPMLRAVSRCEHDRLACNTKRHSRFFHYLKGLNVHASDATLNTLCAAFTNQSSV